MSLTCIFVYIALTYKQPNYLLTRTSFQGKFKTMRSTNALMPCDCDLL